MSAGILAFSLFCLLTLSSVCSLPGPRKSSRKCTRCGPGKKGHCYGPDLCCPNKKSCFGTASECQKERGFLPPCRDPERPCGGQCKKTGLCCNKAACLYDLGCQ